MLNFLRNTYAVLRRELTRLAHQPMYFVLMLVLPVGGFLCLGTLIAVMQWALAKGEKKAAEKNEKEGN